MQTTRDRTHLHTQVPWNAVPVLVTTVAPVLPLTLTMVPLDELLRRLVGMLF